MPGVRANKDLHGRRKVIDLTGVMPKQRRPRQVEARQELERAIARLKQEETGFGVYDAAGVPEEWLPLIAVRLKEVFCALLRFQREVNAVVASDPDFAAVRQLENLKGVELLQQRTAGEILETALLLSEWAPVDSVAIVRGMIQTLGDTEVDGNNI